MSTIVKPIPHTVDLNEPVKKTYIDTLLATEDNLAHRFDITLLQGGQAVAMPSGAAVTAYFIRYSDNATVPITGGAVNGNVASVTLTKACYNKPGQFALIIKVSGGGIVNTVFYGEGTVYTSSTDKVVNDENIVPTLTDLLAQIKAMEAGTAAANTATNRANAAANRCEQMQIDASGMAGDSNKLGGQLPGYYAKQETVNQLSEHISDAWASGTTYAEGDYCISGNQLYKCKTAHTAGSVFNADYWDAVDIAGEVKNKFGSSHFAAKRFNTGTTYKIELDKNYNDSAIIFGCSSSGEGILITYGNGYIGRLHQPNNIEVTSPSPDDGYRSITIKNNSNGAGFLGVIAINNNVEITQV